MADYDFIIVGGGTSGCVLASRLANTCAAPTVLLLEAGGKTDDPSYLYPADRFSLAFDEPSLNWQYKTEPQSQLKGQQIDYSRGKGLGGSSAINFCAWLIGGEEEFNEWARLVGDDAFDWKHTKERLKKIEHCHQEIPATYQKYVNPKVEDHGTAGALHLAYGENWEPNIVNTFQAAEQCNMPLNPDINSGNPIGFGMAPACIYDGRRHSASSAYLSDHPPNMTILLNSMVDKILFSGSTAIGVRTTTGLKFYARKETILCGGAINSPQLLMLSGVGPSEALRQHDIPVIQDLQQVGKNLQDHCFAACTLLQKPWTNERTAFEYNGEAKRAAKVKDKMDGTNTMSMTYSPVPMGWFKRDSIYDSSEFMALSKATQEFLLKPTVGLFEISTHAPLLFKGDYSPQPNDRFFTAMAYVMNPQSTGTVLLSSTNPLTPPKINPNFLSHSFDRRVAIEGMLQLMTFLEAPAFQEDTIKMIGCPKSRSEEDVWDYISTNLGSSWHMSCTVKMGKTKDDGCVDSSFGVFGVNRLRVADLSVLPLLPNNHTQSTAYLIGETIAEKLVTEYGLQAGKVVSPRL
ncbi:hypothetical protein BP6252_00388 [Coleophoma cylindrospora]|uniref:Glucose-methanol-choline oxidoreductase N-terminal domain-containing protein n=1 Tax=Coleophoma cylindrospora TaxID=1849047 RepID=A0A3D8SPX2_9HELO|nr:hypothetical protein BP6252_00388 [Coleophoma cylindrospora]